MKKIAIYGAGGFGRETRLLIKQINAVTPQWEFIGYFDDNDSNPTALGNIDDLNNYNEPLQLVVAIADPEIRKNVVNKIHNENVNFPVLIHPSVVYDSNEVTFGEGSIVTAMSVLTSNITIGKHVIVNLATTIGHDNTIGDFCSIMPGVHLSGNIEVNEGVLVGTGARVLQNLTIGAWSKIGAGAVVINDVKKESTVVGVPAKEVMKNV